MNLTMPSVLSWVLGGNVQAFNGSDRSPYCLLAERPKHFHEQVTELVYAGGHCAVAMNAWVLHSQQPSGHGERVYRLEV